MLNSSNSARTVALHVVASNRSYRCYFTDGDDRIQSYEPIECGDDAQAVLTAQTLLAASPFASAELWQGQRLVWKSGNVDAASPRHQTNADSSI